MANRLIETLVRHTTACTKITDKITEVYHEETVAQIFFTLQSNVELTKYDFYSLSELIGVRIDMGRKNVAFDDRLEKFRGKIRESNLNSRNVEEMHNCIVKFFNEFF